jgi:hypothetical protein
MVGIPNDLLTKKDWYNAVEYAMSTGDGKSVMLSRLNNLKSNTTINVLKKTSEKIPADEQTADDFEAVSDPNCEMARLGFTLEEVESLIGGLK